MRSLEISKEALAQKTAFMTSEKMKSGNFIDGGG
jgi:hypothetical protein